MKTHTHTHTTAASFVRGDELISSHSDLLELSGLTEIILNGRNMSACNSYALNAQTYARYFMKKYRHFVKSRNTRFCPRT